MPVPRQHGHAFIGILGQRTRCIVRPHVRIRWGYCDGEEKDTPRGGGDDPFGSVNGQERGGNPKTPENFRDAGPVDVK